MKTLPLPSQARLKELLDYDPLTGGLVWRVRRYRSKIQKGEPAGCWSTRDKYLKIRIDGKLFLAHRLIWKWQTNEDPSTKEVDHKDRDRTNNCWVNLRLVEHSQNMMNASGHSKLGLPKGVHKKRTRFGAQIMWNRSRRYLGTFDTPEEAHQAYCKAADQLHGEFACLA